MLTKCLSQSWRGNNACHYKLLPALLFLAGDTPLLRHLSPGRRVPVVDILGSQCRGFKYLYPCWNVSLHCLVNYLMERGQTISLPFLCKSRKWPGAFFAVIEMIIANIWGRLKYLAMMMMMMPFPHRPLSSPPRSAPSSLSSTGPINQAAATCLGNINLVAGVDVFGTFLSVPACCFGSFLSIHGGMVEDSSSVFRMDLLCISGRWGYGPMERKSVTQV